MTEATRLSIPFAGRPIYGGAAGLKLGGPFPGGCGAVFSANRDVLVGPTAPEEDTIVFYA